MSVKSNKRLQLRRERLHDGLCMYCGERPFLIDSKGCLTCNKKVAERQKRWIKGHPEYNKNYRDRTKQKVLDKYGSQCVCCGENQKEFLTIDHINKDGAKHRKSIGNGYSATSYQTYLWIIKHKYPDTFRVLCFNCNVASYIYGKCPHEQSKENGKRKFSCRRI